MNRKKSLRETMAENAKAMDMYAKLSGQETPAAYTALTMHNKPQKAARAVSKPSATPAVPLEHEEKKNLVKWFRTQYPKVRIFAVPNAAARDHNAASYMRAEGLSAGCPDLWIPEWCMTIEMKRLKGSVTSDEQISWRDYLLSIGWKAYICNGFEDAKSKIIEFNKGA